VNYPHLHLIINHVPILGSVFALLLVLWGTARGSREVRRLALWVALLAGLSVYPAYFTGEEAHEQVEDYPGFDHDATHEHEEAAEFSLIVLLASAGAAGVALFLGRGDRTEPGWARGAVLLGLVASTATVARTAWIGGEIRHEEIRGPLTSPPTMPAGAKPSEHRHDVEGAAMPAPTASTLTVDSAGATPSTTHVHKDGKEHTH
jgi:hypothetical protein